MSVQAWRIRLFRGITPFHSLSLRTTAGLHRSLRIFSTSRRQQHRPRCSNQWLVKSRENLSRQGLATSHPTLHKKISDLNIAAVLSPRKSRESQPEPLDAPAIWGSSKGAAVSKTLWLLQASRMKTNPPSWLVFMGWITPGTLYWTNRELKQRLLTTLWNLALWCPRKMWCPNRPPKTAFRTRAFSTGRPNTYRYIRVWLATPTFNNSSNFWNVTLNCERKILRRNWTTMCPTSRSNRYIGHFKSSLPMDAERKT
jgi:hypothetical protein